MRLRASPLLVIFAFCAFFGLSARDAHALTLSPPSYDFTVDPGNVVKDVLRIYNEGTLPLTVEPELYNFTFQEEIQGNPDFYPENDVRNGHELAPWIRISRERFVIEPGQNYNFEYEIAVPEDGEPGGHFGAIHMKVLKIGDQAVDAGSQVNILGSTSSLILVRVTGAVQDKLEINYFSAEKTFFTHLPVDLRLRVLNRGNTHLRPVGNVFIQNMFGKQVASIEVNPGPMHKAVLPASGRRFDVSWYKTHVDENASELTKEMRNFAFGKYTALVSLNYGPGNEVISSSFEFWVVPWQFLLILLAVLIAVLIVLKYAIRGYNRMVIRRYEALKQQGKS